MLIFSRRARIIYHPPYTLRVEETDDEFVEILNDGAISSVSILAREAGRAVLASLIIGLVGAAGYGIVSAIERAAETARQLSQGIYR